MNADRISTPFEWIAPPSSISRSISTTSPSPMRTVAVIRIGWPKNASDISTTTRALIWPARSPSVEISIVPSSIESSTRSE